MQSRAGEHLRVETTTATRPEAAALAASVIRARLAACAQLAGPIESHYRWQAEVHSEEEWLLVMKTAADRLPALVAHIRREHSYEVPEIVAVPIAGGDPEYLAWVVAETRPAP